MLNKVLSAVDFINTWADGISLVIFLASIKFGYDSVKKVMNKHAPEKPSNDFCSKGSRNKKENCEKPGDSEQIQKYISYLTRKCFDYDENYEKLKLDAQQILVMCIEKFYYAESLVEYRQEELKSCQVVMREQQTKIVKLRQELQNYRNMDCIEDLAFCSLEKMLSDRVEHLNNIYLNFNIALPQLARAKERVKELNTLLCSLNKGS